jgi:hypothetical protein
VRGYGDCKRIKGVSLEGSSPNGLYPIEACSKPQTYDLATKKRPFDRSFRFLALGSPTGHLKFAFHECTPFLSTKAPLNPFQSITYERSMEKISFIIVKQRRQVRISSSAFFAGPHQKYNPCFGSKGSDSVT